MKNFNKAEYTLEHKPYGAATLWPAFIYRFRTLLF